jgi:hypothetical protein
MSTSDINSTGSKNGGLGAKADSVVKQAQTFGRDMKDQASDLTQAATQVVKTQAGDLAASAKEMASDAGDKLRATVTEQKAVGADYVGNVANIIRRTAYEFDGEMPQAGHYIRKAASQLDNVSQALRNQDVSQIVGNVQDFARKQPTAFLGAAVLLGFATVRFLKSGTGSSGTPTGHAPYSSQGGVQPAGM